MNKTKKNKAVFLDRDGVINHVIYHKNIKKPSSPWNIKEFKLFENIKKPLEELKKMNFLLFIISNQPDIARGNVQQGTTEKINKIIHDKFPIEEIKICPHDDKDNCRCRKPKPGMIFELSKKYDVDIELSFVVGDGEKDMKAGKKAGCTNILIDREYNKTVETHYRVKDLLEAVEIIKIISKN